jgi:hypothetical protein
MRYGETALGVECALPRAAPRHGPVRRLFAWLASALRRAG